jgi:3-deoxy-D-manno-octulosonic-acid transferase
LRVTGSLKFDGARLDRDHDEARHLAALAGVREDDVVFLAGSTQHPEEQYALDAYRELRNEFPRLRLIIVPRHPHRFDEVARILDRSQIAWQRRSSLEAQGADPSARVLLVDSIGELGAWWATAHIGFVGGSLGRRGGQNMIEPAAYGVAVSFGPNTRNFRDVVESMLAHDAARVVHDGPGLTAFVRQCLHDPAGMTALGRRAQHLVASQMGAADRTIDLLNPLILAGDQAAKKLKSAA